MFTNRYLPKALLALLAAFLLLEVTVRVLGLTWRVLDRRPDPWVGTTYPKGAVVRWGKEGFATTRYMADGEIATPFDEGMEILVLGDSHTEAWQVNDRDKYVSVAEALLWHRRRRVNLRNLGRGGLSFADQVYRAGELCKRRPRPAALVIQVSDPSFFNSYDQTAVNFFRKTESGCLTLVHCPPDPSGPEWRNPWWTRSRLITFLQERRHELLKPKQAAAPQPTGQRPSPQQTSTGIIASVTAQAQLLADRVGDTPVIFLRAPQWPYGDRTAPAAIAFRALDRVRPWPLIDPGPEMERFAEQTHHDPRTFLNTLPTQAHLNRYGDAILGQMLADRIEQTFFPAE